VAADTSLLGNLVIGMSLLGRSGDEAHRVGRFWSTLNLRLLGFEVTSEGAERLVPDQPYVVMANHQSYLDIWSVYAAVPLSIRWVMKQELREVPVFGLACERMGHVYVERGNRESAQTSMQVAADRIASGTSVVFFPEGTRSKTGDLGPFKSGGFRLAMAAGVPILPVTLNGTRELLPNGAWRFRTGRIHVVMGEPIPTAELGPEGLEPLMQRTRDALEAGRRSIP